MNKGATKSSGYMSQTPLYQCINFSNTVHLSLQMSNEILKYTLKTNKTDKTYGKSGFDCSRFINIKQQVSE